MIKVGKDNNKERKKKEGRGERDGENREKTKKQILHLRVTLYAVLDKKTFKGFGATE